MLGLDPDPGALWPGSDAGLSDEAHPGRAAARAVLRHCVAVIDAAAEACVAVKPQLARFEALGPDGWATLAAVVEHAHAAGLLVIADGKRGDIDVTARAYAAAQMGGLDSPFGHVPGLGADMVTVNPLMGRDAIEPFLTEARRAGAGVLLLVRTSNPGARDVEDLPVSASAAPGPQGGDEGGDEGSRAHGAGTVWERLAAIVDELGAAGDGPLSDVGAVLGATAPEHLRRARELMPRAPFLLPGVGAQGGRVEQLRAAFAPGRAGGLVSASRSIVDAHAKAGGEPPAAARAEAERLRQTAWELSGFR